MKKLFLLLSLLFFVCDIATSAEKTKPNFVFILMDDMGWTDLSCYGSKFFKSPNIDKLAAQGMKFTDAYAACPVCSPTRASILTGKYPARLKVTDFIFGRKNYPDQKLLQADGRDQLALEEVTLAEALKEAGYVSGAFGKWHLGGAGFEPDKQGFDVAPGDRARKDGLPGSNEPGKGDFQITDQAIKFIEGNRSKSFFAYIAYNTPHIPLAAPKKLVEKYERKIDPTLPHTNATYAAMIEVADAQIGRLLAKLDELKLAENTVVIFTSDNGGLHVREWKGEVKATQNTPLRAGKGFLYEGGIRVPLIVRWPGVVEAGATSSAAVSSVDYFPTLLEAAGAKSKAQNVDGESLVGLLKKSGPTKVRELFWHYPHYPNQGGFPGGAVRDGDYKLIEFYEDGHWELYNVHEDVPERNDLAGELPEKAAQLAAKLDIWRRNVGAEMMFANPEWNSNLPRVVPAE